MARLASIGYEIDVPRTGVIAPDNSRSGVVTGTLSISAGGRTGSCCAFDSTGSNLAATQGLGSPAATGSSQFIRAYFKPVAPASTVKILRVGAIGGISVRLTTGLVLQLWNDSAGTQIGSDSAALSSGVWSSRVELKVTVNTGGQITDVELRLGGATVASTSGLTLTSGTIQVGWIDAPGASKILAVDDVAINDSTGAANNSWPGDGQVVLLKPTADSAVGTGWTLGTGTAMGGNGFAAVDNVPPVGVADLAAGSDPKQIRQATNNTAAYDATMQTYTAAGLSAGDTVNAVQPWIATAAPVSTSAKLGTFAVLSNPAGNFVNLGPGGTSGAFWSGVAGGTYPTGWKWSAGSITEAPSVTLGTAPVMRVNQNTASTRIAVVCSMFVYVDFTPAVVAAKAIPPADRRRRLLSR